MNARKYWLLAALFFILLALPSAGRYAAYYHGRPSRPEVARPALEAIQVPTPPAAQYADETRAPGAASCWWIWLMTTGFRCQSSACSPGGWLPAVINW